MRGGDKKGRDVEFSREEFRNNLQTVTVAVEEGSDKRGQEPIQWGSGKNIGVITLMRLVAVLITGKPGVGLVDKFDSGREKRVLAYDNLLVG